MTEDLQISNSLLRDAEKLLNRLLAHHIERSLPEWDQGDRLVDQISAHLATQPAAPLASGGQVPEGHYIVGERA